MDNVSLAGAQLEDSSERYRYLPTVAATVLILALTGLVLLVGVVGNILVLIVVAAVKSMRTTVNRCLFTLAAADLVILVFLPILPIIGDFDSYSSPIGAHLCNFLSMYDRGACVCSLLVFFYLTLDRYMAVCHPMKSRWLFRGNKTYIILVAMWVVSFSVSTPYLLHSVYEEANYDNKTVYFCYYYFQDVLMIWYDIIFTSLIFFFSIPFLVILYGKMVYTIRSSVPKCGNGSESAVANRKGRGQVVAMLLCTVAIFVVCLLPFATLTFFHYLFPQIFRFLYDEKTFQLLWFGRIMRYVNSASNPVVYFSISTNFRNALVKVCFCRKKPVTNTDLGTSGTLTTQKTYM